MYYLNDPPKMVYRSILPAMELIKKSGKGLDLKVTIKLLLISGKKSVVRARF